MKKRVLALFMAVAIAGSGLQLPARQMHVVSAEETETDAKETQQFTLYTKEKPAALLNVNVARGYYQDRQSLGVYMKKGAKLSVRIVNAEEFTGTLTLDLLANDNTLESTYQLPTDGTALEVTAELNCVPFVRTPEASVCPTIEIEYSTEGVEPLTYYAYGGDMDAFLSTWRSNDQEYAVIDGNSITILVPRVDIGRIPDGTDKSGTYYFTTIDEMLEYYDHVQEQYDAFIGVSEDAEDAVDQNVKAKYFLKADVNGWGAAYYSASMYIAQTSESISDYLRKDWMSLHEIAHGYDGDFTSGDFDLGETINNIFGHYYERTMLVEGDSGWSGLQDIEAVEKKYNAQLAAGNTFDSLGYDGRLYFFLNLLNKTGAEEMMADLHHAWRVEKGTSVLDFVAEQFCETSGYNLIPYFEDFGITVSEGTKERIWEKNYPILNQLRDHMTSDDNAKVAMDLLNGAETNKDAWVANGIYGLVTTEDLAVLERKGDVQMTIETENLSDILCKEVYLFDGEEEIAKAVITSNQLLFEDVPIGTYRVVVPAVADLAYYTDYTYVAVQESATTDVTVAYQKAESILVEDNRIRLLGIADWVIADITTEIEEQAVVSISTKAIEPHWYFSDVYTSVEIISPSEESLYKKEYLGNVTYDAGVEYIKEVPIGSKINIQHKEWSSRVKVMSNMMNTIYDEYRSGLASDTTVISYIVTAEGLRRADWDDAQFANIQAAQCETYGAFVESMLTEQDKYDLLSYYKTKANLRATIDALAEEYQKELQQTYAYLYEYAEDAVHVHQWSTSYTIDKAATDTSEGEQSIHCAVCNSIKSGSSQSILIQLPAAKNVKAKLYGKDDIKVTWSKVTGAKGYYVYYKKASASTYTLLKKTTATTVKKANLAQGTQYTFKVVPYYVRTNGEIVTGTQSKTASVYTLKKVNVPTVKKKATGKVKVTWKNIVGETGYQISCSTKKTATKIVKTYKTTTGKSQTIKVTKGKTYYYKVRAYKNEDGKKIYGTWSKVKAFKLK